MFEITKAYCNMEPEIIYTHNRNWYAKIKDGKLIVEIPFFLRFNEKWKNNLIEKGKKLLEKQKKYEHLNVIDWDNVLLFWESVEKSEISWKLEKEIKNILLDYITPLVDEYSEKLGYKYKSIRVWKAKTKRWSCSFDQKLMFNINLVHLPTKYIRYVVVHEVCHLKHKNHSDKFWAEVEKFLPNYKETKKELKKIIIN